MHRSMQTELPVGTVSCAQHGHRILVGRSQMVRKWSCCQTGSTGLSRCTPPNTKGITMSTTLSLVSELDRVARALDTEDADAGQPSLPAIAEKIARIMGVRHEEVAILAVSSKWKHLHFLVPEALKNVGFIPITSAWSLAARTVRESRPEIDNNFSATRHPMVFEGVRINGETPEFIRKILSAPI